MGGVFNKKLGVGMSGGFTLIEMIIVIVIIGILAGLAMDSFGKAQKQARFNIALDSVMSTIKQQQGKAKTGRQVVGGAAQCYGVFFQKTKPFIQMVTVPYVGVPTNVNSPYADYCATSEASSVLFTPFEMSDAILVEDIVRTGTAVASSAIMFKPPFGAVLQGDALANIAPDAQIDNSPVRIFMNQKGGQKNEQRGIQFDPLSGLVSKVNNASP